MKETYEQKKRRIMADMAIRDIEKSIIDAKNFLKNPQMIGDVDLNRVRKLSHKNLAGVPGLEREVYVFAFRDKFHRIEGDQHLIITDAEVTKLLNEIPEVKLFYVCTNAGICALPDSYVNKDAKAVQLKGEQEIIDYIKQITGVEIKK
jgi:hypothetical protein